MKVSTFINIIPGPKLRKRCKTNANTIMNKESSDVDDEVNYKIFDSTYSCKEAERNNFSDSAEALGFSPIKLVGKRDIILWTTKSQVYENWIN